MARATRSAEVVDLTGDSDSAASQKPPWYPAPASMWRSKSSANLGNKQSATDHIDLTVSDDDSGSASNAISIKRGEAKVPSSLPPTASSSIVPGGFRHSPQPAPKDSATLPSTSGAMAYPIRQSARRPASLTQDSPEISFPSTRDNPPPSDVADRFTENDSVSVATNAVKPTLSAQSTRKYRTPLNGKASESESSNTGPRDTLKSNASTKSSRSSSTITIDLPQGFTAGRGRKTAATSITGGKFKITRPVIGRTASQPIPKPAAAVSAISPSDIAINRIPVDDASLILPGVEEAIMVHNPRSSSPIASHDIAQATAMVETALKTHLRTVHESHAYLVKASLRRSRQCFERDARENQQHATANGSGVSNGSQRYVQSTSPFKKIKPVQTAFPKTGGDTTQPFFIQEVFHSSRPKNGIKSKMVVPLTRFQSTAIPIPHFREYVPLKDNLLAENQEKLYNWPFFLDEKKRPDMDKELRMSYRIKKDIPSWDDKLIDVHRFYGSSIESFLEEIGIGWEDVMWFLLAPYSDLKLINDQNESDRGEYEEKLRKRDTHWEDGLDPQRTKWERLLDSLPAPSTYKLRLAALACESYFKQSSFKLWHLARRSKLVRDNIQKLLEGKSKAASSTKFEYRNYVCRICQMHNCPYHGAFEEAPGIFDDAIVSRDSYSPSTNGSDQDDSDDGGSEPNESESESDASHSSDSDSGSDSDSDVEVVINHRRYVNTHTAPPYIASGGQHKGFTSKPPPGDFKASWWKSKTVTASWEKRTPFFPCKHEGPCDQAQCRCFRHGITCEKICSCSDSCERRFPGCSCAQSANGKQTPCRTAKCLCLTMGRECDADLCGSCGATEILDPVNRYNEDLAKACGNVAIQRSVPKKTFLGHSEVHGFGLYVGEDTQKDDFIGEYVGEVVSVREGERRGIVYTRQQTMYLFKLNSEQDIDSTHFSNKSRFINNANPEYTNCYPKDKLCNGVHRLGLYASTNIKAGTELFFHYGYSEEEMKNFKQPSKKKTIIKNNTGNTINSSNSNINGDNNNANLNTNSNTDRSRLFPPGTVASFGPSKTSQLALKSASTNTRVAVRRTNKPQEVEKSSDDNDEDEAEAEDDEWEPSHPSKGAVLPDDDDEHPGVHLYGTRRRAQGMQPAGRSITQTSRQQQKEKGKEKKKQTTVKAGKAAKTAVVAKGETPRKKKKGKQGGYRPGAGRKRKRVDEE